MPRHIIVKNFSGNRLWIDDEVRNRPFRVMIEGYDVSHSFDGEYMVFRDTYVNVCVQLFRIE